MADTLPVDLVDSTEKTREKDRRQVTREEKILQQKEEHVSVHFFLAQLHEHIEPTSHLTHTDQYMPLHVLKMLFPRTDYGHTITFIHE